MTRTIVRSSIVSLLFLAVSAIGCASQPMLGGGRAAGAGMYDVTAFGAKGDGKALDTPAINKAIDAAAAASGGTVHFPPGTYLSVSIHLKSNVALHFDQGATLLAAAPSQGIAYDAAEPNPSKFQDQGHSHWHNSLIWGENLHDITIDGPGLIWGKGMTRSDKFKDGDGDKAIALKLCRNIIIRDISILHGGHFAILATGADNMTVDNVKFDTNRDGIDIDCCKNVRVSNCFVNSPYDDGLCLKASYGLNEASDTENVTITNCQVSGYDEGTFLDGTYKRDKMRKSKGGPTGRIKAGTESNGGFKNITISNCVFEFCRGLALETVDGGQLEDIAISNITMRDIVNAPMFLRLGARMRGPEGTPVGDFKRVSINNVVVYNADPRYASIISGIPGHDIQDVKLSGIRILYRGGGTKKQATTQPAEKEKAYPEPAMFGEMPAYGFYIRHVKGIELNNVQVGFMNDDLRPAFVLDQVTDADFRDIKAQHAADVPVFALKNVSDFRVHESDDLADTRRDHVDNETIQAQGGGGEASPAAASGTGATNTNQETKAP